MDMLQASGHDNSIHGHSKCPPGHGNGIHIHDTSLLGHAKSICGYAKCPPGHGNISQYSINVSIDMLQVTYDMLKAYMYRVNVTQDMVNVPHAMLKVCVDIVNVPHGMIKSSMNNGHATNLRT
jgi:hypothetical protein